mgnify:CR=1 FL=1
MNRTLKYNGELVNIGGHNIHICRFGNIGSPKIVLMSGSGTVAPVYDFKILYEKLSKNSLLGQRLDFFKIFVIMNHDSEKSCTICNRLIPSFSDGA